MATRKVKKSNQLSFVFSDDSDKKTIKKVRVKKKVKVVKKLKVKKKVKAGQKMILPSHVMAGIFAIASL